MPGIPSDITSKSTPPQPRQALRIAVTFVFGLAFSLAVFAQPSVVFAQEGGAPEPIPSYQPEAGPSWDGKASVRRAAGPPGPQPGR